MEPSTLAISGQSVTVKPENCYDNSMLDSFRTCPRKFYFRHRRHWASAGANIHLGFGSAWHGGMDILWATAKSDLKDGDLVEMAMLEFQSIWDKEGLPNDDASLMGYYPKTPGRAREMYQHYLQKYRSSFLKELNLLAVEEPFIVPLTVDESELYYMGRWDKVYEYRNRIYITDHKTTKSDKSQWSESFSPNNQVDGYLFGGHAIYGDKFWGVMIDGALVQKGSKGIDGMPPGIGFPKLPVQRALGHLDSWRWETIYSINMVIYNDQLLSDMPADAKYLQCYPKNTNSCHAYGGCIYRDLCKFIVNPHELTAPPEGFTISEWSPLKNQEDASAD